MFTGIVEGIGTVVRQSRAGDAARLTIRSPLAASGARPGDSVMVDGVCLTVAAVDGDEIEVDVMGETLRRSTIGTLPPGARVDVERPLSPQGRLGGHVVQGHVDAVGEVVDIRHSDGWRVLRIGMPADIAGLVAFKGSIAVNGVSLTVSAVSPPASRAAWFEVSLIPETLARTTLGLADVGTRLNLETDVLARQLARLDAVRAATDAGREGREEGIA